MSLKDIFIFLYKSLIFVLRITKEKSIIYYLRFLHLLKGGSICPGKRKYKDFVVKKADIFNKEREPGISGFYRVKNEEYLLEASVESHVNYLDEIIIVYNDCQDKTPEIAKKLQDKYPDKIKVYEYKPKVYPTLSKMHAIVCSSSPHSLANYYNFALSKTTKQVAVKIDADHIAVSEKFKKATELVRNNPDNMFYLYGVNVFPYKNSVYVNKKNPFTAGYDCAFFPVNGKFYFVQRLHSESLKTPISAYFTRQSLGVLFYHLKGFKKDKGVSILDEDSFMQNKKSNIKEILYKPELVPLSYFAEDEKMKDVPVDIKFDL